MITQICLQIGKCPSNIKVTAICKLASLKGHPVHCKTYSNGHYAMYNLSNGDYIMYNLYKWWLCNEQPIAMVIMQWTIIPMTVLQCTAYINCDYVMYNRSNSYFAMYNQ